MPDIRPDLPRRVLAGAVGAACVLPFMYLAALSLARRWTFPHLRPETFDISAWARLGSGAEGIGGSLLLSLALSTAAGFITGRTVGYDRHKDRWLLLAYAPFVLSPAVLGVCLLYVFLRVGLAGGFAGVAAGQFMFAYAFDVMLFSGFWNDEVRAFLERGGALFCFCGWFTDWIPGNRWVHDNSHPTREVRHRVGVDRRGLFAGVDLAKFDHNAHGISGWWACGFIEPAPGADAVLLDTWDRALVVLDETTTPGLILATASGPLGDFGNYGGGALAAVYRHLLRYTASRRVTAQTVHA